MKTYKTGQTIMKWCAAFVLAVILTIFMYEGADPSYQNDSEKLAVGPIVAEVLDLDIDKDGFGLGRLKSRDYPDLDVYSFMEMEAKKGYKYRAYSSQIGLQGHVYSVVAHVIPRLHVYLLLRMACCFFLVVVLMMIVRELYKKYGVLFAAVFGAVTFLAPCIVDFSRNLYWVEFTWFLPMLLGIMCLNRKKGRLFLYPLFFAAVFVKCLCGYEYLSTVMMAGIMFLLVEWICRKDRRREIFRTVLAIGILSVAAFLLAIVLHACICGDGNLMEGVEQIRVNLIERRTWGSAADFDPVYTDSLNASALDVLIRYFWIAGNPYDGKLMLFLAIVTIFALIYQRIVLKKNNKFEISLFIITLLTALSWLILGKAHSFIHIRMNMVLFYMGWVQADVYIICRTVLQKCGIEIYLRDSAGNEISNI